MPLMVTVKCMNDERLKFTKKSYLILIIGFVFSLLSAYIFDNGSYFILILFVTFILSLINGKMVKIYRPTTEYGRYSTKPRHRGAGSDVSDSDCGGSDGGGDGGGD